MITAFIIRDIPDLDHFTPIIYKFLAEKQEIVILNYEINLNLRNDFRIKFLENKYGNLKIVNLYSFLEKGIIYSFLSKIFSIKNYEINFKNLKHEKKFNSNIIKYFIISFCKKIFFSKNSLIEDFFFNKEWIKKIFNILQIKAVILDDSFYFNYNKAQRLVDACKDIRLKVHLFPHTCFIIDMKEDYDQIKNNLDKFNNIPNIITNSEFKKKKYIEIGIGEKNISVCGSGRFSPEWMEIFKDVTKCNLNKKLSKTKVLYLVGIYNNQDLEQNLIKFLSNMDNISLVVKTHPRGFFSQKQIAQTQDKYFNLDINTPSTKLIYEADIVIGTFSSILVDAFIFKKTVIYPKFLIDKSKIDILYAGKNFTIDCENNEQISAAIKQFQDNKLTINQINLDKFLQEFVYGNKDKNTILNDYFNLLKPE